MVQTDNADLKIGIKHMVCARCLAAVEGILRKCRIPYRRIAMGEVELEASLSDSQRKDLERLLEGQGFELLADPRGRIVSKVKTLLLRLLEGQNTTQLPLMSEYLQENVGRDFSSVSRLFSSVEGVTIERYFLKLRIEKVKEELYYNERSISQIAYALGFSSPAHLSSQFRQETGMSPSAFRKMRSPDHDLDI